MQPAQARRKQHLRRSKPTSTPATPMAPNVRCRMWNSDYTPALLPICEYGDSCIRTIITFTHTCMHTDNADMFYVCAQDRHPSCF